MSDYKERMQYAVDAHNQAYSDIKEGIGAILRQTDYIEKNSNLLRALNYASFNSDPVAIKTDIHLEVIRYHVVLLAQMIDEAKANYLKQIEQETASYEKMSALN